MVGSIEARSEEDCWSSCEIAQAKEEMMRARISVVVVILAAVLVAGWFAVTLGCHEHPAASANVNTRAR